MTFGTSLRIGQVTLAANPPSLAPPPTHTQNQFSYQSMTAAAGSCGFVGSPAGEQIA